MDKLEKLKFAAKKSVYAKLALTMNDKEEFLSLIVQMELELNVTNQNLAHTLGALNDYREKNRGLEICYRTATGRVDEE